MTRCVLKKKKNQLCHRAVLRKELFTEIKITVCLNKGFRITVKTHLQIPYHRKKCDLKIKFALTKLKLYDNSTG